MLPFCCFCDLAGGSWSVSRVDAGVGGIVGVAGAGAGAGARANVSGVMLC